MYKDTGDKEEKVLVILFLTWHIIIKMGDENYVLGHSTSTDYAPLLGKHSEITVRWGHATFPHPPQVLKGLLLLTMQQPDN